VSSVFTTMSDQYVSKKVVNSSYRPKSYEMSPGLRRARAPFRVRNAITGLVIASFAVGVWAYSISAVKQDNFDDVDEEAKTLVGSGTANMRSIEDQEKAKAARVGGAVVSGEAVGFTPAAVVKVPLPPTTAPAQGILAPLVERWFPRALDPQRKTFVWGAPPVNQLGRILKG